MNTARPYADYTDGTLELTHKDYVEKEQQHANYANLARELAAAHAEIDVQSNATDLAEYHDNMASYYHGCALECAAERRARDADADAAAEQHEHNSTNGC